jgi:hypothetical protein
VPIRALALRKLVSLPAVFLAKRENGIYRNPGKKALAGGEDDQLEIDAGGLPGGACRHHSAKCDTGKEEGNPDGAKRNDKRQDPSDEKPSVKAEANVWWEGSPVMNVLRDNGAEHGKEHIGHRHNAIREFDKTADASKSVANREDQDNEEQESFHSGRGICEPCLKNLKPFEKYQLKMTPAHSDALVRRCHPFLNPRSRGGIPSLRSGGSHSLTSRAPT